MTYGWKNAQSKHDVCWVTSTYYIIIMNIDLYTVHHNMIEKHLTDIRFAEKWPRVDVHFNSPCLPRPSLIHPTAPSRDFDWRSWLTSEFGWETRATKRCFERKCSSFLWAIWGVASRVNDQNLLQKLSFKAWSVDWKREIGLFFWFSRFLGSFQAPKRVKSI